MLRWVRCRIPLWAPVRKTIPHAMTSTTTVRMAVARLELTFSIPIFARMEVSAANTAEPIANIHHMDKPPFPLS